LFAGIAGSLLLHPSEFIESLNDEEAMASFEVEKIETREVR